jgi:cytochrome c556
MQTARRLLAALALAGIAATAAAHSSVDNAAVQARMDAMKRMATHLKTLGEMAKGNRDFDAAAAQEAARRLEAEAGKIPALFEPEEDHPASEAKAAIWEEWEDFTGLAEDLAAASEDATGITAPDDLRPALRELGASCGGCHQAYRE